MRVLGQVWRAGLALGLVLPGCAEDSSNDAETTGTKSFRDLEIALVNDATLEDTSESIQGTGTIKLVSPLAEESAGGAHVGLTFQLLGDDSEVSLITFANAELEGGIKLTWSKTSATVTVGDETKDLTAQFTGVDWAQAVSIRSDTHNDEEPTHLIVWQQSLTDSIEGVTPAFDSASPDNTELALPSNGTGTIGAIMLKNAILTNLIVTEPQQEEDDDE